MSILLTGFDVFDGLEENPSLELVRSISLPNVKKLILPVSYKHCFDPIEDLIAEDDFDFIICMGVARKRNLISLERVAVNLMKSKVADNDKYLAEGEYITKEGPESIRSTLPIDKLFDLAQSHKFEVEKSDSAGEYVCNCVLYKVLWSLRYSKTKAGFIHLPPFEKLNKERQLQIIETLLKSLASKG